jgi:hypothetical protein
MYRIEINIQKRIVSLVAHLQELYLDARSRGYKFMIRTLKSVQCDFLSFTLCGR